MKYPEALSRATVFRAFLIINGCVITQTVVADISMISLIKVSSVAILKHCYVELLK